MSLNSTDNDSDDKSDSTSYNKPPDIRIIICDMPCHNFSRIIVNGLVQGAREVSPLTDT